MAGYLIDNNIISGYFSELFSERGMDFITEIIDQIPNISIITKIEALSWINPDPGKEKIIREFVKEAAILNLTDDVVDQCVKIRRSRKIKTPDAIIAATAIAHGLTLVTSDKGFNKIPRLRLIDPYNL